MGLQAGTRLGPFEIRAAIGAGGMGEVYHARDTRLDRDVTPDGERFLVIKEAADIPAPTSLVVVENWFDELKRLMPR